MTTVAFSMGKAPRTDTTVSKTVQENPGPGNYNDAYRKGKKGTDPSWSMGTSKRADLAGTEAKKTPGPGTHRAASLIGTSAPKYQIGARFTHGGSMDTLPKFVPGPGAYTPQKTVYDR